MELNQHKLYLAIYYNNEGKIVKTSVTDYLELVSRKDKIGLANFIYNRLHARYINPFLVEDKQFKIRNGFSKMANSCLLIETLESFKQGLDNTSRISEKMFINFFQSETHFDILKSRAREFYKNIP